MRHLIFKIFWGSVPPDPPSSACFCICKFSPRIRHLRRKKIPVVPVHDRPYFFLPTLLFFQRDWPCDHIFSGWLRATAKMASVVTLIIEKPWKKYSKKNFRPTDPNFFAIWNRNHRFFFYAWCMLSKLILCYIPKSIIKILSYYWGSEPWCTLFKLV
jgi:hypothetical protein